MSVESPVIRWDSQPLNLSDPQKRFKCSQWNYFLVDQQAGVLMGYWLAEQGHEDLGEDDFDEVLHVIEGKLYVTCEGEESIAGPGETVVVRQGCPHRIAVREPTRVFFVSYRMSDPAGYEAMVQRALQTTGT